VKNKTAPILFIPVQTARHVSYDARSGSTETSLELLHGQRRLVTLQVLLEIDVQLLHVDICSYVTIFSSNLLCSVSHVAPETMVLRKDVGDLRLVGLRELLFPGYRSKRVRAFLTARRFSPENSSCSRRYQCQ
jgi:hypothetical protein